MTGVGPGQGFDLRLPSPKPLTIGEELAAIARAFGHDTATAKQRMRFASLLLAMDKSDAALALLDHEALHDDYEALMMRADVHLRCRRPEEDALTYDLLIRAAARAGDAWRRARALAELGRAAIHLQDRIAARNFLSQALGHNPLNADAFRRLALLAIGEGDPVEAEALADGMLVANRHQTWALTIRAAALMALGDRVGAQDTLGLDRFALEGLLPTPDGWASLADFNRALAAELETHPGLRFERYGTAAVSSWRIDEPLLQNRSPIFAQLQDELRNVIKTHVESLIGSDHPFLQARPFCAKLNSWVVLAGSDGHESWHVHPEGWLSGVYYVDAPLSVTSGNTTNGCLEFAIQPYDDGGLDASPARCRVLRPRPGAFMLFPSCNYHRTRPMNEAGRRICVAFDVVPHDDMPDRP